jgi:hypothetical protein
LKEILGEQMYRKLCLVFFCAVILLTIILAGPNIISGIFVKLILG